MNKLNKMLVMLLMATASMVATAEGKIAVLNVQEAIINTTVAQERLKALQAQPEFAENRQQLETLKKTHDETIAQLQKDLAVMSPEQKQTESKKIQDMRGDMEHVARKLQAAEQELGQALMQEYAPKMQQVVTGIIESDNIGLLLDRKAAMHVDSSFSITAKVTEKLNAMK